MPRTRQLDFSARTAKCGWGECTCIWVMCLWGLRRWGCRGFSGRDRCFNLTATTWCTKTIRMDQRNKLCCATASRLRCRAHIQTTLVLDVASFLQVGMYTHMRISASLSLNGLFIPAFFLFCSSLACCSALVSALQHDMYMYNLQKHTQSASKTEPSTT